jgi:hypothetical protein
VSVVGLAFYRAALSCKLALPALAHPSASKRQPATPFATMPATHTVDRSAGEKIRDEIAVAEAGARRIAGGCIDWLT